MAVDKPLDAGTELAVERSRLASERTLMAWIRTSMSMISFGFSISKFFQYLGESAGDRTHHGPVNLGRVMVILGVLLLVPAIIRHGEFLEGVEGAGGRSFPPSAELGPRSVIQVI